MKLLGALLVVIAGGAWGILKARNLRLRPKQLQSLRTMLQEIRTGVDYGLTPLPELMRQLAEQGEAPVRCFATTVLEQLGAGTPLKAAWQQSLEVLTEQTPLQAEDLEPLAVLGRSIGSSDSDDQLRHLELAMVRLEHRIGETIQERDQNARLYTYLGLIGSLALVIALF
jgi:stage III sporulation protein AB